MHLEFQIRVSKLVIPESRSSGFRATYSSNLRFLGVASRFPCSQLVGKFVVAAEEELESLQASKQEERFIVPTLIKRAEEAAGLRSEGENMVNAIKGILISW
jgi:hypothetical protein